jgi:drug/metabolite transporter (DMT)-like permease
MTLGAIGISWAPIFVALSDVSPEAVAFWRYVYALPFLAALALLRLTPRASFRKRGWMRLAALSGVFFTIDLLLWHRSIVLIGAGPATLLANTHVIWITAFGLIALDERPGPAFWVALPGLAAGMWLLAGGDLSSIPLEADRWGLLLATGSGVGYACALICIRSAQRRTGAPPEAVLLVQIATALLALLPVALLDPEPVLRIDLAPHIWLLGLGLGVQVIAWWAITFGISRIPGYHGSALLFAQPVGSVILGWWVLDQALPLARLVGAVLILGAIALTVLRDTGREAGG